MMKRLDFGSFGCHTDMAGRAGTNSNARNSDVTHVEVKTPNFASTKSKKASQNQKAKEEEEEARPIQIQIIIASTSSSPSPSSSKQGGRGRIVEPCPHRHGGK
jgi:hypothetical protein